MRIRLTRKKDGTKGEKERGGKGGNQQKRKAEEKGLEGKGRREGEGGRKGKEGLGGCIVLGLNFGSWI